VWLKYAENTSYQNAIANTINKNCIGTTQQQHNNQEITSMLERMQAEKVDQNLLVRNMNGLSSGQHLNNLGITTNGSSDPNLNT